ncbi:MAG: GspE/PulE family protein [Bacillota bacterium]
MKNIPIGEMLKQYGYITEEQLRKALNYQRQNKSKYLSTILIEMGYLKENQILEALGKILQVPVVNIKTYDVRIDAVGKVPKQMALKHNLIGLKIQDGKLYIAIDDPLNFYALEDVRQVTNMPLVICLADTKGISDAIEYYYAEIEAKLVAHQANTSAANNQAVLKPATNKQQEVDNTVPVVKLLNSLLMRGYSANASDIHIEPFEDIMLVRMRIDGMLVDYIKLAINLHSSLIARIKIVANMDIAEKRLPQDGHFKTDIEGVEMNVRVSVIPTVYGEKAVMRFLSTDAKFDNSGQFGMDEENYQKFITTLQNPHGIIYLTGPTGSGKTTTLYMAIEYLARKQVNISTIEDPVERNIPRINQMQVNNVAGLTFESGLRALLRQDPDIIMVGETRDAQTASISTRAAITGHLVLSTLHTNDAVSAIVRLADMGVPSYLIANSLVGVVAQRLVRKICPQCGYEYTPDEIERFAVGPNIHKVRKGKGCHLCNNTGYKGRMSIHEIISIDKNIRRMILHKESVDAIYEYALKSQKMKTLKDSMLDLVKRGVTTVEELLKLTYYVE